jgi:hypothetical protein
MTYRGHIKNGRVVLKKPVKIPEGTEVSVTTVKAAKKKPSRRKKGQSTLYEELKDIIGKATGLPSDASINHDHYLYGVPKRK